MDLKKEALIKAYAKAFGNVSKACEAAGVSRKSFYRWMKNDEEFKEAIDSVMADDLFVDFAEEHLVEKIRKGDTTAIIFALKTRGKKRGYVERQEIANEHKTQLILNPVSEAVAKAVELN
jgi:hypothetical protein|tara:strand:- start:2938 stop:3297 length:360 start_codon:yes stop_codon:yes gene_type:complete